MHLVSRAVEDDARHPEIHRLIERPRQTPADRSPGRNDLVLQRPAARQSSMRGLPGRPCNCPCATACSIAHLRFDGFLSAAMARSGVAGCRCVGHILETRTWTQWLPNREMGKLAVALWRYGTIAWRRVARCPSGMAAPERRWLPGRANNPRHGLQTRSTGCSAPARSACHPEMRQELHFADGSRVRNVPVIDLRDLTGCTLFAKLVSEFSSQRFRSSNPMAGEDVRQMPVAKGFFCPSIASVRPADRNAQHR